MSELVGSVSERVGSVSERVGSVFDLLIQGGRVIDPREGIDAVMDVGIREGRVSIVQARLDPANAARTIDAGGKLVTPGLVDLHAHVFRSGVRAEVDPLCGVGAGVTSIVDAGSAGVGELGEFEAEVNDKSASSVYSFLYNHWWSSGYEAPTKARDPAEFGNDIDLEAIVSAADTRPDMVKGIKVAVTPAIRRDFGLEPIVKARAAASAGGLRLMLHVGDIGNPALPPTPSTITSEAIGLLEPGDILTHVYSPMTGGPLDESEALLPAVRSAQERGVIMDAAMGDYGFSWAAAARILGDGIAPDTVSSDFELHAGDGAASGLMVEDRRATGHRVASVTTLVEYMAYYLVLGFSIPEVIGMVTATPARAAGIDALAGDLRPGKPADVSVLDIESGAFTLRDVTGECRIGRQAFLPHLTVKGGEVFAPSAGLHPWGFAPPAAEAR